jgi:hypothetical protein
MRAISSYTVVSNGALTPIRASVPTLGAATCWLAVTPNGQLVDHITPRACNFPSEDVIKRPWDRNTS